MAAPALSLLARLPLGSKTPKNMNTEKSEAEK
jgi:hypothetical protein